MNIKHILKQNNDIGISNKIAAQIHLENLKLALKAIYGVIGNNESLAIRYKRTCERLQDDIIKVQKYRDSI